MTDEVTTVFSQASIRDVLYIKFNVKNNVFQYLRLHFNYNAIAESALFMIKLLNIKS